MPRHNVQKIEDVLPFELPLLTFCGKERDGKNDNFNLSLKK